MDNGNTKDSKFSCEIKSSENNSALHQPIHALKVKRKDGANVLIRKYIPSIDSKNRKCMTTTL